MLIFGLFKTLESKFDLKTLQKIYFQETNNVYIINIELYANKETVVAFSNYSYSLSFLKKPRKKPAEEKSAVVQEKKPKPVQEKAKTRGSKRKAEKVDSAPEEKRKPAARRPRGRKPVMVDSATSPINWRHLK